MTHLDDVNGQGLANFAFEMEHNWQTCNGTTMPGEQCGHHTFCCSLHENADVQPAVASHVESHVSSQLYVFSGRNLTFAKTAAPPVHSSASDVSMASSAFVDDEYSHAWASIRSETSKTQPLAEWMEQHFLDSSGMLHGSFRSQSPIMQLR